MMISEICLGYFKKIDKENLHFSEIFNFVRLENALRSFACLTCEDLIEFKYNDKVTFFFFILYWKVCVLGVTFISILQNFRLVQTENFFIVS